MRYPFHGRGGNASPFVYGAKKGGSRTLSVSPFMRRCGAIDIVSWMTIDYLTTVSTSRLDRARFEALPDADQSPSNAGLQRESCAPLAPRLLCLAQQSLARGLLQSFLDVQVVQCYIL